MRYDMSKGVSRYFLQDWKDCRQRAEYKSEHWRVKGEKPALRFGGLVHGCLEDVTEALMKRRAKKFAHSAMLERIEQWYYEQSQLIDFKKNEDDILLEKNKVWLLMAHYIKRWWKEDQKKKWLASEYSFDVTIGGYRLRGRVDGLLEINGELWILETKTTSQSLDSENKKHLLSFDFQNLFYALCVEEATGKKVKGIIYNLIKKPQHKTIDKARDAVDAKPRPFFKRIPIILTKKDKKIFRGQLMDQLKEFAMWAKGDLPTYRNESACHKIWICEFCKACASHSMVGYEQHDRHKETPKEKHSGKKRKPPKRRRPFAGKR